MKTTRVVLFIDREYSDLRAAARYASPAAPQVEDDIVEYDIKYEERTWIYIANDWIETT